MNPSKPSALCLALPAGCPVDVAELAQLAALDGPELLSGTDPAAFGPVVVHPSSPACPDAIARQGLAALRVEPVASLVALARDLRHDLAPRPGWWPVLLVGREHVASVRLAPLAMLGAA